MFIAVSAFSIPTTFTRSKSSPFETICVPISMSVLPFRKSDRMESYAVRPRVVSRSRRAVFASGNTVFTSASTCSVPIPWFPMCVLPHLGHREGTVYVVPQ